MKNFLIFLGLFFLSGIGNAQKPVDRFIDEHLHNKHAVAMTLPGWLVRKGGRMGQKYSDEKDDKEFLKLTQYIKKLRFLVIDKHLQPGKTVINQFLRNIHDDGFERFVNIRSKKDHVHLFIKEKREKIKCLVVLVHESQRLVVVNMKMDMPMQVFEELDFDPKYEEL